MFSIPIYAQRIGDTLISYLDTINVHGKVIDSQGRSISNAIVVYGNDQFVKTNNDGIFKIVGVKLVENFKVLSSSGTAYFANQSSRYLLITIKENEVKRI